MSMPTILRAFAVWLSIIVAESIHGALRAWLLAPLVGDFASRQIGVFTGTALIFGIAWFAHRWMMGEEGNVSGHQAQTAGIPRTIACLAIGAAWVMLTVAFEVGLGRALGMSWSRIAADYRLWEGGLMPLGLVAMLATPWIVARLRRKR